MKVINKAMILILCVTLVFPAMHAWAGKTPGQLAQESEQACAASAGTKPSPEMIMDKVAKAASLLEKEGRMAFDKFKGQDSEFIFAGTYIWIHDMDGVMLMHPIKYKMEGKRLIGLKDAKGKRFFTVMNKVAKEQGAGWVDYMWPKPGEKKPSQKVSYVKRCHVDGQELIVGCGIYDMEKDDIRKLVLQ